MSERAGSTETPFWGDVDDSTALQRYQTLVNTIDDGIYQLDTDGRFVAVNDVIVEKTGYAREELLGSRASMLLDDMATIEREVERRLAESVERKGPLDITVRTAGGGCIPCELRLNVLVEDGEFRGTVGVVRDVADRERAEQTLTARERQLEQATALTDRLLDVTSVAVAVINGDGEVERLNERARSILGISDSERATYPLADMPVYDEGGRRLSTDECPFARALETGEPVYDRLVRIEPPDRERRWLSVNAAPVPADGDASDRTIVTAKDVTELKERERERHRTLQERERRLEESERRYRTLVENFPNGAVALVDEDVRYQTVGGEPLNVADVTAAEIEGKRVREALPTALADELAPRYEAALEGESDTFTSEHTDRVFEFRVVPVRDDDGDVFAAMGMSWDITEREERKRKLAESERRYRTLVENFPNGAVGLFDEDLRYQVTGGDILDEVDTSTEEIIGQTVRERYPKELADQLEPKFRAALDGERNSFEMEYHDRWWLAHTVPVSDESGEVFAGMTMAQDITERKESKRKLAESERRFRTLAENFPNGGVGVYDRDLRYTLVTGTMWDDIEPDPEDLEGNTIWEALPADTAADVEPVFRAALDGETGSVVSTLAGRTYKVWAAPLRDADGEITGGQSFALDVTERIERERKLEETVEMLEESNARLESFASMLAHELRNPVNIGQIYSQQLPTDAAPNAVEYVTEAFDRIEDMIDVMLVLTRDREAVGESSPLSIAEAARDAWENAETAAATIEIDVAAVMRGDETYVRHLFRNLFENAVQHGGRDVTVRVGELPAESANEAAPDEAVSGFYVADDGEGIPPDERDEVFEVGFTTAAEEGGTGLGLAFVKELAGVYGWDYSVTESEAGGARFEFRNVDISDE